MDTIKCGRDAITQEVFLGDDSRQFFTNEFKEEAVKLVADGKLSVAEAARRLSLSPQTLKNWVTKHRAGNLNAPVSMSVSELESEVSRLRKELAEARLEKEILKKAMA